MFDRSLLMLIICIFVQLISVTQVSGSQVPGKQTSQKEYVAGEHYTVLDNSDSFGAGKKIEIVEMFSYGCPHCYEFEPLLKQWAKSQADDVAISLVPAVWNQSMKVMAKVYYTAQQLGVTGIIHYPLFTAIVIEQRKISSQQDFQEFFSRYGMSEEKFNKAYNSKIVEHQADQAESRVSRFKTAGVPEIIINNKYRIDRMRAGGYREMLAIMNYLVEKERSEIKK